MAKAVLVTFVRGPLHLLQAHMKWIPEVNVFTDERDGMVYAYIREELTYYFDPEMSAKLTAGKVTSHPLFRQNQVEVVGEVKPKRSVDSK